MDRAISLNVKNIIKALQIHHSTAGKPASLRDLAAIYGVSHQTLSNWAKGAEEHFKLFSFIERARKALDIDESKAYNKVIKQAKK